MESILCICAIATLLLAHAAIAWRFLPISTSPDGGKVSAFSLSASSPRFEETNIEAMPSSVNQRSRDTITQLGQASLLALSLGAWRPFGALADDVKPKKAKKPKVLETELGIKYVELKKGSGPFPSTGDFIVLDYIGFLNNGTVFDSTETKGRKPLSFRYGKNQIIPGIESVLSYMQPGAEVTCTIPSVYAYGSRGICVPDEGCIVPPDETLKYVLKLKNVGAGYN
jgi:hypothetical protein